MSGERRRALVRRGLQAAQVVAFLAPILGLLAFWFVAFRLALTLSVSTVGLSIALLKVVEAARLRLEIDEIVRRTVHEHYAH